MTELDRSQNELSAPGVESFVARTPVLDRDHQVVGYELVFPPNAQCKTADGSLIEACLHVHDLESLTGTGSAFIKVSETLLLSGVLEALPERTVLELIDTVRPTEEVIAACRALRKAKYTIALDDFDADARLDPLVEVADILKFRFTDFPGIALRRQLVTQYATRVKHMLAICESKDDADEAKDAGFSLFQGFFFCEPEIVRRQDIPRFKQNYLRFLEEIRKPALNQHAIENIIKQEVSLSVKLLRYLNSSVFGLEREVTSIGQALVHLGEKPLRQWGALVAVTGLGDNTPHELIVTTMTRARFCELLGKELGMPEGEPFLVGLLSTVDALLGRPRIEILRRAGVGRPIMAALSGDDSPLGHLYQIVLCYERGRWGQAAAHVKEMSPTGCAVKALPRLYREAVHWVHSLFQAAAL